MDYSVSEALAEDWEDAIELCWRTFLRFEACDYSKEGCDNFLNFISGEKLYQLFLSDAYKMLVAKHEGKIIGVISARSHQHISLLFVDEKYHKNGVGKALVKALQSIYSRSGDIKMTVNSSPYAVGFYHKLGFMDASKVKTEDGITYTPMELLFRIS